MFSVKLVTTKNAEIYISLYISLKIYQITKCLEEKYLLTFLSNLDLLIVKC